MVRILYSLYCILTFVMGLLLVFPGVIVALFLKQPASGNLVIHLSRAWANGWMFVIGMPHKNTVIEPILDHRQYVFVANHISYMDIPVIFKALPNSNIRVLGKMEMAKVPLFGVLYKLAVILVDRSSPERRARSIAMLKDVLVQNISIFIFPEGTFNETGNPLKSFYDGAFRMAIETETPIKPLLFLDTIHRLHYRSIFSFSPGKSRAVVLPEIPVTGLTMADVPMLRDKVFAIMESGLKAYY